MIPFLLGWFRFGLKGRLTDALFYSARLQHSQVWGLDMPESAFYKGPIGRMRLRKDLPLT